MNKEEMRRGHKRLWGWLARHPYLAKHNWPELKSNGGTINEEKLYAFCFPCQYTLEHFPKVSAVTGQPVPNCRECPMDWREHPSDTYATCMTIYGDAGLTGGYFLRYSEENYFEEKRRLAVIIRDIPERSDSDETQTKEVPQKEVHKG